MSNKNKNNEVTQASEKTKENSKVDSQNTNKSNAKVDLKRFASVGDSNNSELAYRYIDLMDYIFPDKAKFSNKARGQFYMFGVRKAIIYMDKSLFIKACSLNPDFARSLSKAMYVITEDEQFVKCVASIVSGNPIELTSFNYGIPMDAFFKVSTVDRRPSKKDIEFAKAKSKEDNFTYDARGGFLTENNLANLYKLFSELLDLTGYDEDLFKDYPRRWLQARDKLLSVWYPNGVPSTDMSPVSKVSKADLEEKETYDKYIAKEDDNQAWSLGMMLDGLTNQ